MREEVLNVALAVLLGRKGIIATPELRLTEIRAMPDVLVSFKGLRLIIEGKVGDLWNAEQLAWRKARERVEKGIAHLSLALVYPPKLREAESFEHLLDEFERTTFCFAVCIPPIPEKPPWRDGDLEALRNALEVAFQQLASEDEVKQAADVLREAVRSLAQEILAWGISVDRLAYPLGIPPENISKREHQRAASIAQIASLILTNALLFQEELANVDPRVKRLRQCFEEKSPYDELLEVWRFILQEINYHAVFDIARQVLLELPATKQTDEALKRCVDKVLEAVRMRVALQHDVAGRLYHLLLGDIAKPLGTYYTSVSAATLMLRLAFDPERWEVDWRDLKSVGGLRIADFACGTGTLLMAAQQAIVDNFLRVAWQNGGMDLPEQRRQLLKNLLEKGIWGMDVLQSAVHLTATTLTLLVPEVTVKGMNLYALDLGVRGDKKHLGSLDLLRKTAVITVALRSSRPVRAKGKRVTDTQPEEKRLELPEKGFDLICMNPPFTRSTGGNLLFGSLPEQMRKQLQKELQRLIQGEKLQASATAGLGSVFLALADRYLKDGGRLAFVLPKALLSGVEWQKTRQLLKERYVVEVVLVSHDPERWNFSENTDLSEVLLIARKVERSPRPKPKVKQHNPHLPLLSPDGSGNIPVNDKTVFVNLWHNPTKALDALFIAEALRKEKDLPDPLVAQRGSHPALTLWVGDENFGEAYAMDWDKIRSLPHWLLPCAFAQVELIQTLMRLYDDPPLPLCPLRKLGELGPQRRDIYDAFENPTDRPPGYPAFWGMDAEKMTTMAQQPNAYLKPLTKARKGRPLRDAKLLWNRAGRILIAERMRLNTQRLPAVLLPEPVLSNMWWPLKLHEGLDEDAAKILVLWLNSTLGTLLFIANRLETQGAWVTFKKPTLHAMPVLDVRQLTKRQRQRLTKAFDELSDRPLLPLSQIDNDEVRKAIDDAFVGALNLPDLTDLRKRLAMEPILTLKPLRQRRT